MKKLVLAAFALCACADVAPVTRPEPRIIVPARGPNWSQAQSKSCQGGCVFNRKKEDEISHEKIDELFAAVSKTPVGSESEALDLLLFHDTEVRAHLAESLGGGALTDDWRAYLGRELSRRRAWYSLRIVDEHGVVRSQLPEQKMALGQKLHMEMTGERLQPFNANGTLVRVGRDHVWQRM